VALSAYFLRGVVPHWRLTDIYRGMLQFMVIQLVGLVILILFPSLVLFLPQLLRN
jgi:TRAP-type mannitol/chloroaromatic compound transport system permease large subunit